MLHDLGAGAFRKLLRQEPAAKHHAVVMAAGAHPVAEARVFLADVDGPSTVVVELRLSRVNALLALGDHFESPIARN